MQYSCAQERKNCYMKVLFLGKIIINKVDVECYESVSHSDVLLYRLIDMGTRILRINFLEQGLQKRPLRTSTQQIYAHPKIWGRNHKLLCKKHVNSKNSGFGHIH